ncbi:MAG: hypothetical protein ABWX84_09390 [Nocardioides sp.]
MTAASVENPYAGQGAVMLDIGGDVGAVVVTMPSSMLDEEVEIRPLGVRHQPAHDHAHLPHVAVVERPVGAERVPSLVFPDVREGRYGLCVKGSPEVLLAVDVRGGEVTMADWPV